MSFLLIKNPFTKDFRGGEEKNESIDIFSWLGSRAQPIS
jgi:hypothetical protein